MCVCEREKKWNLELEERRREIGKGIGEVGFI